MLGIMKLPATQSLIFQLPEVGRKDIEARKSKNDSETRNVDSDWGASGYEVITWVAMKRDETRRICTRLTAKEDRIL